MQPRQPIAPPPETKVITIDGPAGAGKSTVAKRLAKVLHYFYLDTGAMYRALTYKALNAGIDVDNEVALVALAQKTHIDLEEMPEGIKVLLDGVDVSEAIRSVEVTQNTSIVSAKPGVRQIMVGWQQSIGGKRPIVIEGRDTGTVVFPHAAHKFYLDADLAERARRREKDLRKTGTIIEADTMVHQINERDNRDQSREVGPLKKAADAIKIDTTNLSVEETVTQMLQLINKHA